MNIFQGLLRLLCDEARQCKGMDIITTETTSATSNTS